MESTTPVQKKCLPLHSRHVERGAKLGLFGEWEVPLYYTSILEEHQAVRTKAGVFDISHMGEFLIEGSAAETFLEQKLSRPISGMPNSKALYMPLLHENGGIVDDIILYRYDKNRFLMIVNAGNVDKDWDWMTKQSQTISADIKSNLKLTNQSSEKGLLALQGPLSAQIIDQALGQKFSDLPYYHCREWGSGMVARTGYTGEDGFEIMVNTKDLDSIWKALFKTGQPLGLIPVGFGARDTLRLEAGMLLYGHDMDDTTTPLEAGIQWAVDLKKSDYPGRNALLKQSEKGLERKLIGFEMIERGIPRQGFVIKKGNQDIGQVTSGSFGPTIQKNIGLGYVQKAEASAGNEIDILIRDKAVKARIVSLPFYRRKK